MGLLINSMFVISQTLFFLGDSSVLQDDVLHVSAIQLWNTEDTFSTILCSVSKVIFVTWWINECLFSFFKLHLF